MDIACKTFSVSKASRGRIPKENSTQCIYHCGYLLCHNGLMQLLIGNMISLENFNPYDKAAPGLDSPRSLEACCRQGFKPAELRYVSFEEYKKTIKGKASEEWLIARWEHHENKRKNKLRAVKEERAELIQNESIRQRNLKRWKTAASDLSIEHKQSRELQKIREKKEREMRHIQEYEEKVEGINARNQRKVAENLARDETRKKQLEEKLKAQEARNAENELRRKQRMKEENYKRQTVQEQKYEKELIKERERKVIMERQKVERLARAQEQKQKHEELKRKTKVHFKHEQRKYDAKRQQMEQREKEGMEQKGAEMKQRAAELEERAKTAEERVQTAKHRMRQLTREKEKVI
eukprot:TRINITY_DN8996_c0_g1_i15.p1 TRINITY_DN8996_c0_g1~~TRINITY_DN8996_c0_g1_i15.p1  ORF type:complete len:351 (+),score=83.39 TRINITY_DN8996_c0_g1_i15:1048-2100(+)